MAGYSQRTLLDKLGVKPDTNITILNLPNSLKNDFQQLIYQTQPQESQDFILYFTETTEILKKEFPTLKKSLKSNGYLWISWPKKTANIPTDLNENIIREIGLTEGLVDVKVCAIDQDWSGLKFVYRLKDRHNL